MNQIPQPLLTNIIARYSDRLTQHGFDPKTLGWSSTDQQYSRFRRFVDYIPRTNECSILDFGCGFGDFAHYLSLSNIPVSLYTGLDLNPDLIKIANQRNDLQFPTQFISGNIFDESTRRFVSSNYYDITMAAGVFNYNFYQDIELMYNFLFDTLDILVPQTRQLLLLDFIPSHRTDSYDKESYIATYSIDKILSYLTTRSYNFLFDLLQEPNPMTECLLCIQL